MDLGEKNALSFKEKEAYFCYAPKYKYRETDVVETYKRGNGRF